MTSRDPVKYRRWTLSFLLATAVGVLVPVGMEIWAVTDGSDNTAPWTEYVIRFIPWWGSLLAYLGLVVLVGWLALHFVNGYRRWRARTRK